MIQIIVGDTECPKGYTRITELRLSLFGCSGFGNKTKLFVDCDALKIRADKIKWIIKNTKVPTILLIKNKEKLKSVPKTIKVINKNPWDEKANIFKCLDAIFKEKNRQKVLAYLLNEKPPPILLFNWMVANVNLTGNVSLLLYLDNHILHKKPVEWFYEFLAFGTKRVNKKWIPYKYRIGRG